MKGKGIPLRPFRVTVTAPAVYAWEQTLQDIPSLPGHCDEMMEPFSIVASTSSMQLDLFMPIPFIT